MENKNYLRKKIAFINGKASVYIIGLALMHTVFCGYTVEVTSLEGQKYSNTNTSSLKNIVDIGPILDNLGIKTKVDEEKLEIKYPSAKISTNPENGNATLTFHNPQDQNYKLEIYDMNRGLVASFVNINSDQVVIEKDMFTVGAYIYKLVATNSNIYCGTFMLR